ncbi:MAG: hypothetical protein KGQ59_06690 [Bdellovibrionales bacterium]|nr:hypothetical protein [Bdellovibrionales bacterium]
MLANYGIVGNGRSIGFISSLGSIDWLCAPDYDSPSHFGALLDNLNGGRFSICPVDPFSSAQHYLGRDQRSAVLETRFTTASGVGRLVDWMPWLPSPTLIRRVETIEGVIDWQLTCSPRFHYGQSSGHAERIADGIRFRAPVRSEFAQIFGTQNLAIDSSSGSAVARFQVAAGRSQQFCWSWGRDFLCASKFLDLPYEHCLQEWDQWLHHCNPSDPSRVCPSNPTLHKGLVRSEVMLRLLTHSGTGAMIQSPCTHQNWDHRYCWIRHCPSALNAWILTGHLEEAEDLWRWIKDRLLSVSSPDLLPAYNVDGSFIPEEREIHSLRGHAGARPVRIGNSINGHLALDTLGSLLECCLLAYRQFGIPKESPIWMKIEELGFSSAQLWRRPDHGYWDSRFRPEHYLSSKLACWRGLESAIKLLTHHQGSAPTRWSHEVQQLKLTIIREGFNASRKTYTQAFGETEIDSSALLIGLSGFQAWDSTELVSTLVMVENELKDGAFIKKNKPLHSSPDFEGGHLLSTLWWVSCLFEMGRNSEAQEILTEICRMSSPHGILPEGMSASSGSFSGDFPSARVHCAFIDAAQRAQKAQARRLATKTAA